MRKLLPLLGLLLCYVVPASATVTFTTRIASATNAGAGKTVTATITGQVAGNSNIIGLFWCGDNTCGAQTTTDTVAVTDGAGNSYTCGDATANQSAGSTNRGTVTVCHSFSIAASASNAVLATVTSSNAIDFLTITVSEWSPLTAKDQTGLANSSGTTVGSPISETTGSNTTQGDEVVYAVNWVSGATLSAGASYTILNAPAGSVKDEYQIVSSTGSYTATMTYTSTHTQLGALVTFKGAATASGGGGFGGKAGIGGKAGMGD